MTESSDAVRASLFESRRSVRQQLVTLTDELIAEFAGWLPAGTVVRYVGQAREQQLATGMRSGMPVAAAALARTRLRSLLPAHGPAI